MHKKCIMKHLKINSFFYRLSENGRPFEARIKMPVLKINARYMSSGVLFILPASGNGTFNALFGKPP